MLPVFSELKPLIGVGQPFLLSAMLLRSAGAHKISTAARNAKENNFHNIIIEKIIFMCYSISEEEKGDDGQ